jgi:hypothetical protein
MRKLFDLAIFGVFLAALLFPAALYIIGFRAREFEARPLVTLPAFAVDELDEPSFYQTLDNGLRDLHPARELMVKLDARARRQFFGEPPGASVAAGEDGFLFLNETVFSECLSPAVIERGVANVAALAAAISARDIPVMVTVAPDKPAIYPDKLTPFLSRAARCPNANRQAMQSAFRRLEPNYVDLFSDLTALRRTQDDVYSAGDTHWTQWGSTPLVRRMVQTFAPELPIADARLAGQFKHLPDLQRLSGLYHQVGLPRVLFDRPGDYSRASADIAHSGVGPAYVHSTSTASSGTPLSPRRVLVIHDSFIYPAQDQISQYFSDVLYVHWQALGEANIGALVSSADVVVIECVEREMLKRFQDTFSDSRLSTALGSTSPSSLHEIGKAWPVQAKQAPGRTQG